MPTIRFRKLGSLFLVVGAVVPAHADNCGSLDDCYGTIAAAVAVAAALAVLVALVGLEIAAAALAEELAEAAAEGLAAGAADAAETAGISLADAVAQGLVQEGGKLYPLLDAIEQGFQAAGPSTAAQALEVLSQATSSLGLDLGYATMGESGAITLANVGGIVTEILSDGEIIISRGSDILLHLIP
jgi:hypothetical protein